MPLTCLNIVQVVVNEHGAIFAEAIELLSSNLHRLGIATEHSTNRPNGKGPCLVIGATVALTAESFRAIQAQGPYIVFQVEALAYDRGFLTRYPAYKDFLRGAAQIWDYSPTNCSLLKDLGCREVHYMPIGFAPSLERIPRSAEQDYDVLFFGAMNKRRFAVLDSMRRRGFKTIGLFGAYGLQRDQAIGKAKILLNLHQFDAPQLEQLRIAYLLNNKCFVISETADFNPYGEGVVFCAYDSISDRCAEFLGAGMESQRRRIAEIGFQNLKAIPMRDHLREACRVWPD